MASTSWHAKVSFVAMLKATLMVVPFVKKKLLCKVIFYESAIISKYEGERLPMSKNHINTTTLDNDNARGS